MADCTVDAPRCRRSACIPWWQKPFPVSGTRQRVGRRPFSAVAAFYAGGQNSFHADDLKPELLFKGLLSSMMTLPPQNPLSQLSTTKANLCRAKDQHSFLRQTSSIPGSYSVSCDKVHSAWDWAALSRCFDNKITELLPIYEAKSSCFRDRSKNGSHVILLTWK